MFDGHAIAQYTADEFSIVPVFRIELLAQSLHRYLIATRILELEVVTLRAVLVHLLDNLTLRHRLGQEDTFLVVLQTRKYLVRITVEQSHQGHPFVFVVLESHYVALQFLGAHLSHFRPTVCGHVMQVSLGHRRQPLTFIILQNAQHTLQHVSQFLSRNGVNCLHADIGHLVSQLLHQCLLVFHIILNNKRLSPAKVVQIEQNAKGKLIFLIYFLLLLIHQAAYCHLHLVWLGLPDE